MTLSRNSVTVLVDLIENKLAVMHVGDREDMRQMVSLQHCLAELSGIEAVCSSSIEEISKIPRRGRGRKVSDLMRERSDEHKEEPMQERTG